MRAGSACLMGCLMSLAAGAAFAAVPPDINVHGQLLDSSGQPLAGERAYRVRFFDARFLGTQIGADVTGSATIPASGLFDLVVTPPAASLDAPELWYELAIESEATPDGNLVANDVFSARVRVYSVPFALRANSVSASGLGNGLLSDADLDALAGLTGNVQAQINAKPDTVTVNAALATINTSLSGKADAANVYTKAEIDTQQAAVNSALSHVLQWTSVDTFAQMEANHGYVATGATQVVFTMPAVNTVAVGDIIRISGAGAGGWRIEQSDNEAMVIPNSAGAWVPRATNLFWSSIACSADASIFVASVQGGQIYVSTDGGLSWTAYESNRTWTGVACSADGTKMVACDNGGKLYTSTDTGQTWTPRDLDRAWKSVSSSADGVKLQACDYLGQIYTSDDSGLNWTPRDSVRNWVDVASSSDGVNLAAAVYGGQIYTSTDSGANWTPRETTRNWIAIACSSDGGRLAACVASGGQIYTSTDGGLFWNARESNREWWNIASSADGMTLLAGVQNGRLYVSSDAGGAWTPQEKIRGWSSLAVSSDGTRLAATAFLDRIYVNTFTAQTTVPGLGGQLFGPQFSAIELQYIGGGVFLPISHEGTIATQ